MTLVDFKAIIVEAESTATHHFGSSTENYTTWSEYGHNSLVANDRNTERALRIQVDRFTRLEADPIVAAITAALDAHDIPHEYLMDREPDTKYIHHIWDCEVI